MSPEGNMPHETSQIQNGKCCQTAFLLETQGENPTDNESGAYQDLGDEDTKLTLPGLDLEFQFGKREQCGSG